MPTTPTRTRARYVEVTLIVFGLYSVLIGLFMFVAPGTFFDTLGNFGARNDHYIFDNATFERSLSVSRSQPTAPRRAVVLTIFLRRPP